MYIKSKALCEAVLEVATGGRVHTSFLQDFTAAVYITCACISHHGGQASAISVARMLRRFTCISYISEGKSSCEPIFLDFS